MNLETPRCKGKSFSMTDSTCTPNSALVSASLFIWSTTIGWESRWGSSESPPSFSFTSFSYNIKMNEKHTNAEKSTLTIMKLKLHLIIIAIWFGLRLTQSTNNLLLPQISKFRTIIRFQIRRRKQNNYLMSSYKETYLETW